MNTPQLYNRVYFHLDRQRSNRYKRYMVIDAINVATDDYIKDRYDNIKKDVPYSFERLERVREELYPLIVEAAPLTPVNLKTTQPADFLYDILMYATINGRRVLARSKSYQENDLAENAFTEPSAEYPIYRKNSTGHTFEIGVGNNFTQAELYYLKYFTEAVFEDATIAAGNTLTVGQNYYVNDGPDVVHNAVTYSQGQTFTAVNTTLAGAGTVSRYVDINLPRNTHEEIARRAAVELTNNSENYVKGKVKQGEVAEQ